MNPCCTVGDHLNGYSAFGGTKGARKEEVRLQSSLIAGKIADDTHVFNESRLSLSPCDSETVAADTTAAEPFNPT